MKMVSYFSAAIFAQWMSLLPAIRIHIWGGLGSQCFGLVIASRIKNKFPKRRILLLFHTSGESKRNIELPIDILSRFQYRAIDDYLEPNKELSASRLHFYNQLKSWTKFLIKQVLDLLNLVKSFDTGVKDKWIPFWIVSCRGHYGSVQLTHDDLELVYEVFKLGRFMGEEIQKTPTTIHFRLGDLMYLKTKTYISPSRVGQALSANPLDGIPVIFSDSDPLIVKKILGKELGIFDANIMQSDPFVVVRSCFYSKCFVGTNSKISQWIAILRSYYINGVDSYIPDEIYPQTVMNVSKLPTVSKINRF